MSLFLKKYFVPVNLILLTTGVFFIAQILTFTIARRLEPPVTIGYTGNAIDSAKRGAKPFEAYKIILDRNIFNSKGLSSAPSTVAPASPGAPVKVEEPPVPVKLVGTVAGNPLYSYAIIEDPFQRTNKIFKLNDTIAPNIKLLEIHRNRITISRNGKKEEIELGAQETAATQARIPAPPRPGLAPTSPAPEVTQPSPSTFVVDRESVEAATQDMNKLLTQARLVPNFTGGAADGFRIFSIVPASLFEKAGLRNGDIIHSINGVELKDPEKAFQIYQLLKDNDRFAIDLVRAGQNLSLNYEVR